MSNSLVPPFRYTNKKYVTSCAEKGGIINSYLFIGQIQVKFISEMNKTIVPEIEAVLTYSLFGVPKYPSPIPMAAS